MDGPFALSESAQKAVPGSASHRHTSRIAPGKPPRDAPLLLVSLATGPFPSEVNEPHSYSTSGPCAPLRGVRRSAGTQQDRTVDQNASRMSSASENFVSIHLDVEGAPSARVPSPSTAPQLEPFPLSRGLPSRPEAYTRPDIERTLRAFDACPVIRENC